MPFFVVPSSGGGGGSVNSVTGVKVNNSDAANPVVGQQVVPLRVAAGDFSGDDYTDSTLIGKTAMTDFDVIAGSFLTETADYTFNSGTGTITILTGAIDMLIIKYN